MNPLIKENYEKLLKKETVEIEQKKKKLLDKLLIPEYLKGI